MRRDENSRTSCPNKRGSAHGVGEASPAVPERTPLETLDERFRDPSGLRALAKHHARRCGADPDDLLSDAVVRALRLPNWSNGVDNRLDGVLSSAAFGINRARARRRAAGIVLVAANDETIIDRWGPVTRDAAQELEREAQRAAAAAALEALAGGDPLLSALIDGIGEGLCGADLREKLGVTELKLASLRKKLKRRANDAQNDRKFRGAGKLR